MNEGSSLRASCHTSTEAVGQQMSGLQLKQETLNRTSLTPPSQLCATSECGQYFAKDC